MDANTKKVKMEERIERFVAIMQADTKIVQIGTAHQMVSEYYYREQH